MGLAELAKKALDRSEQLDAAQLKKAKPMPNSLAVTKELEDGSALVQVPWQTTRSGWTRLFLPPKTKTAVRQFELEPIGAFVWSLCDGTNTYEVIVRKLREKYKMSRVDADASLTAFLQMLSQRRLIQLMVKGKK